MDWRFDGLTALVSIAAGKAADLVVLAGNRAKNIDGVERVETVFRRPLGGPPRARVGTSAGPSPLVAVVAILIGTISCRGGCHSWRTDQADVIQVRGEYTILIPTPAFMESAFGQDWASQTLFYGSNRAVLPTSERAIVSSGTPRKPLVKGDPVFIFSGTDWPDLISSVYSLERKQFVDVVINMKGRTIRTAAPAKPQYGTPTLLPNGTLSYQ